MQRSAELPVTEAVEAYIQYLEDIALIWYDLWGTYAVNGLQITQFETERGAEGSGDNTERRAPKHENTCSH